VGPVWEGGHRHEDALLASCYRASLRLARAHDVRTIAFPAISCGAYRFPLARAAAVAVRAIRDALVEYEELEALLIAAFDIKVGAAFARALRDAGAPSTVVPR
jgi:O-acetyl-ADP-ribose deacetylase